jgi:hypothetical protein
VTIAKGWYPIETYKGETFRWVANDAAFTVRPSAGSMIRLALELEPGPGVNGKPFLLKIMDASGHEVQSLEVKGRQTVHLILPTVPNKPATFELHLNGGGVVMPPDPRMLNFRVFRISKEE